jgi:hypothetical protein
LETIVRLIIGVLAVIGLGSVIAIGFFFDPASVFYEAGPSEEAEVVKQQQC